MEFKFNTGRLYSDRGQIIRAVVDKDAGAILFNDEDRGITGRIGYDEKLWRGALGCEHTARQYLMRCYDMGGYADISSTDFYPHTEAYAFGRRSALEAIDQRAMYNSWNEAEGAYLQNIAQTLASEGKESVRAAEFGFRTTITEWEARQRQRNTDPTYAQMLEFVKGIAPEVAKNNNGIVDDFDISNAIYWFASDNYDEDHPNIRAAKGLSGYRADDWEHSVCPYGAAIDLYYALQKEFGQ